MPWGDGTGPSGMGPMTGRAAGFCAGYPTPGYLNPVPGRGFRGRAGGFGGGGWGRRNWYYATGVPGWARTGAPGGWWGAPYPPADPVVSEADELELLRRQATNMEKGLDDIRQRITELESKEG